VVVVEPAATGQQLGNMDDVALGADQAAGRGDSRSQLVPLPAMTMARTVCMSHLRSGLCHAALRSAMEQHNSLSPASPVMRRSPAAVTVPRQAKAWPANSASKRSRCAGGR